MATLVPARRASSASGIRPSSPRATAIRRSTAVTGSGLAGAVGGASRARCPADRLRSRQRLPSKGAPVMTWVRVRRTPDRPAIRPPM
ncbi:hypothetical protein ACFQVA_07300 [Actinomadura keratinilytica]